MRTKLAALSFTAAILAGILVPAFGGTASAHGSADGGPGCIGQHVRADMYHHGSLIDAAGFHAGGDIGGYLDFVRAHCGRYS